MPARCTATTRLVVMLDEPDSSLDAECDQALLMVPEVLRERGCTVVKVRHLSSSMRAVDILEVLCNGTLDAYGTRDQIMAKMSLAQAAKKVCRAKQREGRQDEQRTCDWLERVAPWRLYF